MRVTGVQDFYCVLIVHISNEAFSCPPYTSFLELGEAIDGHQQLRMSQFFLVVTWLLASSCIAIPVNAVVYREKTNINE